MTSSASRAPVQPVVGDSVQAVDPETGLYWPGKVVKESERPEYLTIQWDQCKRKTVTEVENKFVRKPQRCVLKDGHLGIAVLTRERKNGGFALINKLKNIRRDDEVVYIPLRGSRERQIVDINDPYLCQVSSRKTSLQWTFIVVVFNV